jgi:hypothetical protein
MNRHTAHIWSVTILGVVGVAGIIGLEVAAPNDSEKLLVILVGFLAPTVAALLNGQKQVEANAKLDRIDGRLNGELDRRIEAAIERALEKWTGPKAG